MTEVILPSAQVAEYLQVTEKTVYGHAQKHQASLISMRLWTKGDAGKVREYLDQHGLMQSEVFWTVAQAVLQMSEPKARGRALLGSIIACGRGKQARQRASTRTLLFAGRANSEVP